MKKIYNCFIPDSRTTKEGKSLLHVLKKIRIKASVFPEYVKTRRIISYRNVRAFISPMLSVTLSHFLSSRVRCRDQVFIIWHANVGRSFARSLLPSLAESIDRCENKCPGYISIGGHGSRIDASASCHFDRNALKKRRKKSYRNHRGGG